MKNSNSFQNERHWHCRQVILSLTLGTVCLSASAYPQLGTPGATIVVDTAADGGIISLPDRPIPCTLRDAILAANSNQKVGGCAKGEEIRYRRDPATGAILVDGVDVIRFGLGSGTPVIRPRFPLPTITEGVRIVGNSGGATRVMLDGRGIVHWIGPPGAGLVVAGHFTSLEYLVVSGFGGGGIVLAEAPGDGGVLEPPFTPPDVDPELPADPIADPCGPYSYPADPSQCGQTGGGGGPVMPQPDADHFGSHRIIGSRVGTDATGSAAIGNGLGGALDAGILVLSGGNQIGGEGAGEGNLISGNHGHGMLLGNVHNTLVGNAIGSDATQRLALGNDLDGVRVEGGRFNGATCALEGNRIAYNGGTGVFSGFNTCLLVGNRIHDNADLGIDVAAAGVTANDPNRTRPPNAPVLTDSEIVSSGTQAWRYTRVHGTVTHPGKAPVQVELFANGVCDPSGHGEGAAGLARTTVAGAGTRAFSLLVRGIYFANTLTATASIDGPAWRSTSEFSNCL